MEKSNLNFLMLNMTQPWRANTAYKMIATPLSVIG